MKNYLSKLFTTDNLVFGNIVILLALAIWTLGWKIVFLPIAFVLTFCAGGILQWVTNKFTNTKSK